jgi:hypothetical protein
MSTTASLAAGSHSGGHDEPIETMREMHSAHEHAHDFEAMDEMSPQQRAHQSEFM